MTLTDKIKLEATKKGETFASLERQLGFGQGTIRKWDTSSPSVDKVSKMAKYLGVSIATLVPEDEYDDDEPEAMVEMAICNDFAAAGHAVERFALDMWEDYERLPFPVSEVPPKADYGMRIKGDSMEPLIHDGDIVWVRERVWVDNGDIGIFFYNNRLYCKQYRQELPKRKIELVSINPKYKPIKIEDSEELQLIGKVLIKRHSGARDYWG